MLALLAMARCAGVCGVDTTKAGNVLSGERCDLRNVLCGRCKVRFFKCMCRHSRLKGRRMMFIGAACHELDCCMFVDHPVGNITKQVHVFANIIVIISQCCSLTAPARFQKKNH